jgi:lysyl-tRNA synthetase class 1
MQWKPDFGARWAALGVDFEMFGKDHGPNMPVYDRICSALGGRPPEHYVYELFLDQNGEKISKSKGNGLTIDEWLTYAPTESLALYMFQKPRTAKRLYFDVIPKAVDEYFSFLGAYGRQDEAARLNNPVWHIHSGKPPRATCRCRSPCCSIWFQRVQCARQGCAVGLHLALCAGRDRRNPSQARRTGRLRDPLLRRFRQTDEILPCAGRYRARRAGQTRRAFDALPADADGAAIQDAALDVARGFERYQDPSKTGPDGGPAVTGDWFQMLYQVLLGQDRGPRFGSFVALYGISETVALINKALAGELALENT